VANNLNNRPIIVDTPGGTILIPDIFRLKGVRWVSPAAVAGHLAQITDANDNPKWNSVATGPNYVESDLVKHEKACNGLKVPVLQSGILYIEIE